LAWVLLLRYLFDKTRQPPVFFSKWRLFLRWLPISRRHRRKLKLFYTIYNGLAPQNLHDLIPPTIQSTTIYPLHNGSDLIVPFCRLSSMNSITFNFRGPYMKCLWTIFISFALFNNARLNFNGMSRLRTEFSNLFHSLTEGVNYNGLAPQNLHDLIPPTIQSTTIYPLHNGSDLIVPFCRLSSMNSSFTPSVREWNKFKIVHFVVQA
jgi:hypothetical protein